MLALRMQMAIMLTPYCFTLKGAQNYIFKVNIRLKRKKEQSTPSKRQLCEAVNAKDNDNRCQEQGGGSRISSDK
ncbi:MAG: hypothetical protein ACR5K2_01490 [Wolbachia sp.]